MRLHIHTLRITRTFRKLVYSNARETKTNNAKIKMNSLAYTQSLRFDIGIMNKQ